jgi:hypothetical protein
VRDRGSATLLAIETKELGDAHLADALGALVKYQGDAALARTHLDELLTRARA